MLKIVAARIALAFSFVGLSLVVPQGASAQFYKDKTLNVLINSGAGGNSDSLGRLFMRHMARYIPGNPTMIARNMVGAGGLLGTNYLAEVAKPDGLTIGIFLINGGFAQLTEAPELRARYSDFKFIAGIGGPIVSFIRKDAPPGIEKAADIVKAAPFWATGYNRASTHDVRIRLTLDVIGAKYTMITGYGDANKSFFAILQNEAQFTSTSIGGYKNNVIPNMIQPGIAITVWQYPWVTPEGKFERNPSLPDLPTFNEVYEGIYGKAPSGPTWDAFVQVQRAADLTRAIIAPKDSPEEAVKTLRAAVDSAVKSTEFKNEYEKLMGEPATIVDYKTGMKILENLDKTSPEIKAFLKSFVNDEKGGNTKK